MPAGEELTIPLPAACLGHRQGHAGRRRWRDASRGDRVEIAVERRLAAHRLLRGELGVRPDPARAEVRLADRPGVLDVGRVAALSRASTACPSPCRCTSRRGSGTACVRGAKPATPSSRPDVYMSSHAALRRERRRSRRHLDEVERVAAEAPVRLESERLAEVVPSTESAATACAIIVRCTFWMVRK